MHCSEPATVMGLKEKQAAQKMHQIGLFTAPRAHNCHHRIVVAVKNDMPARPIASLNRKAYQNRDQLFDCNMLGN